MKRDDPDKNEEHLNYFLQLTDNIYHDILLSTNDSLNFVKARKILERIERRELYFFVCEFSLEELKSFDPEQVYNNLEQYK